MYSLPCEICHRIGERIIIYTLDKASSYCSLQYLACHTDITRPLALLEMLEEEGCICHCEVNDWSQSGQPLFKFKDGTDETDLTKIQRIASNLRTYNPLHEVNYI
jgi:hypothetical protein